MASATTAAGPAAPERWYRRFTLPERVLHVLLMITFIGCALTGLPLIFAAQPWAVGLARLLGGFHSAGIVHRVCASVMIAVFVTHILLVIRRAIVGKDWLGIVWGPDSMVPQWRDAVDMYRHVRWFLGLGPRPQFDRWTYWEKFDYWAVFWGMAIIGGSGLLLWFPFFFGNFLPGWAFNIAGLVHGEEALLAVGFIFTIHFFNGHLRPEKFPMDTVVFTGRISEHELKGERAVEYARLQTSRALAQKEAPAPALGARAFGWVVGGTALALGVVVILLILYSMVF
ncbi:MAG TPA: cytochrome b/b6 domain-containing protein [Casimicrobiaceae bacterium]|nr:cytochrome b/b6 domain-containing protein [Casimicrobiaceae bacterium]